VASDSSRACASTAARFARSRSVVIIVMVFSFVGRSG
jgi:hypothetical protein